MGELILVEHSHRVMHSALSHVTLCLSAQGGAQQCSRFCRWRDRSHFLKLSIKLEVSSVGPRTYSLLLADKENKSLSYFGKGGRGTEITERGNSLILPD